MKAAAAAEAAAVAAAAAQAAVVAAATATTAAAAAAPLTLTLNIASHPQQQRLCLHHFWLKPEVSLDAVQHSVPLLAQPADQSTGGEGGQPGRPAESK